MKASLRSWRHLAVAYVLLLASWACTVITFAVDGRVGYCAGFGALIFTAASIAAFIRASTPRRKAAHK